MRRPRKSPAREGRGSQITTYYRAENNGRPASPFTRKTARRSHRRLLFGLLDIIIIMALIIGLFYSLALKPQPKVITSSQSYHTASEYTDAAIEQFSLLKNRNKLTFDQSSISENMQKRFPEIRDIHIELPFCSETPVVRLNIAGPAFKLISSTKSYVVNDDGIAIDTVKIRGGGRLATIADDSGFDIRSGGRVLSSSSVGFIKTLIKQCAISNIKLASITLPSSPQELLLRTADAAYYTKFYLGGDPAVQAGQFLAARKQFMRSGTQPHEYLDVRISGKIFYK